MTSTSPPRSSFPRIRLPRWCATAAIWSRSSWSSPNAPVWNTSQSLEVTQFDFRAEADIAGEQAEQRRLRQRLQLAYELPDPRHTSVLLPCRIWSSQKT